MITRPIKVLVVDDSLQSRKLLVGFLSEDPDIEVVATASNGKDALEAVGKHIPTS
ncbi:MAG: hypothetical protein QUS35_04000 [bacterium]|nr:hypothetical protein [bacterium]